MTTADDASSVPRHVGLDLPPRDARAAFAWCDARVEALMRSLGDDPVTPLVIERDDEREYIDSDRGQEWPAGYQGRFYRMGGLECRLWRGWSRYRSDELSESFSLTILRHEADRVRPLVDITLRASHVWTPAGPGTWCAQRLEGTEADLDALHRFLRAEATAGTPPGEPLGGGGAP